MSPKYYDLLLSKIAEESPEYSLLKNGAIIDHSSIGVQRETIDILCEIDQAEQLYQVAKRYSIDAAGEAQALWQPFTILCVIDNTAYPESAMPPQECGKKENNDILDHPSRLYPQEL